MILSQYFVYFVLCSFLGWGYETIYCTVRDRKWANRGFLFGPFCPIYGVGALAISLVFDLTGNSAGKNLLWWHVFLISFLGSMVLEYFTSWALEKLFHAYWWDYSDLPFNLNGRISLFTAVGFGLAGLLVVYIIYPFLSRLIFMVPTLLIEGISLFLMALLVSDLTLTVSALTGLDDKITIAEKNLDEQMEVVVASLFEKRRDAEEKLSTVREKFGSESMEHLVMNMTYIQRQGLKRVKGFRPKYHAPQVIHIADIIKRKKPK